MDAILRLRACSTRPWWTGLGILMLALTACRGDAPAETPPPGVPDTPYWYTIGDSLFWYWPAESLAVVQVRAGASSEAVSDVLYALRDMGWRMTVERGPALRPPGTVQDLSQPTFQVERVEGAHSPTRERRRFEKKFWSGNRSADEIVCWGILPGLRADSWDRVEYFWPATLAVVWHKNIRAVEAEAWLDSLGVRIVTSQQLTNQYYVQRAWAVDLPAGAELFSWLRKLNEEARVQLAHPIPALHVPPAPDMRIVRRYPVPEPPDPPGFDRLSPALMQTYYIAHFAGNALHAGNVTGVDTEMSALRVLINTTALEPGDDSALVRRYGGRVLSASRFRSEAWIPTASLPELVLDSSVQKVVEVKRDLLRPRPGR